MVVCQFFLRGTCKFGSKCRNEHSQGQGGFGQSSSFGGLNKSSFQPQRTQQGSNVWSNNQNNNNNNNNNGNQDTTEKIILSIKTEMQIWEASRMWPFSCFSVQKERPCLTGLTDYSPEEIRLEAYKSRADNNTSHYLNFLKQCQDQLTRRRTELKNLTASSWDTEQRQMTGGSTNSLFQTNTQNTGPFSSQPSLFSGTQNQPKSTGLFGSNTSEQSLFGQKPAQSIFGQQSSLGPQTANSNFAPQNPFGTQTQSLFGQPSSQKQGLFSQTPQSSAQNIFAQQQQQPQQPKSQGLFSQPTNQMSTGLFTQQPAPQQGLFASQPTQGLFGNTQTPQRNLFGQQPASAVQQQASGSLFGNAAAPGSVVQVATAALGSAANAQQNSNPFLKAAMQQSQLSNPSQNVPQIASSLQVTEKDLAAFIADSFVFGQIPECPPPLELC